MLRIAHTAAPACASSTCEVRVLTRQAFAIYAHDPPTQVGITSLLDQKTEAMDVVALDNYVQPIDRGPSAAEAQKLMRSWQYAVTGKVAAAAALAELKAEHIKHGGCNMLRWSEQTPGLLRWHA